jgi:hypothetical protein
MKPQEVLGRVGKLKASFSDQKTMKVSFKEPETLRSIRRIGNKIRYELLGSPPGYTYMDLTLNNKPMVLRTMW